MNKAPTPIERIVQVMCDAGDSSVDYGYLEEKTKLPRRAIMQAINRASTRQIDYFQKITPGVYRLTHAGREALCKGCVHRPKTRTKPLKHMLEGATGIRAIIWKLLRMNRVANIPDCMIAVSLYAQKHGIKNAENQVRFYVNALVRANFLARRGRRRSYSYALVNDPGPKAPVLTAGGRFYEPNRAEWIEGGGNV